MLDSLEPRLSDDDIKWLRHEKYPMWIDRDYTPIPILMKQVHPEAKPLSKKREDDMAWDVSCVADEEFENTDRLYDRPPWFDLHSFCSHTFSTGIEVAIPGRYGFLIRDRSGIGISDIIHTAGVIEGTYRGEWKIHLINLGKESVRFEAGDRIVQAVIVPIFPAEPRMVDELPESDRGTKGFGSSGR